MLFFFFFFNDTATTEIYTLSLHDALPIASEPALQANSRSAALTHGTAPIASATIVLDGLTAYGFDSVPTQTERIEEGATRARARAPRAASIAIVTVSSSDDATDFSRTGR